MPRAPSTATPVRPDVNVRFSVASVQTLLSPLLQLSFAERISLALRCDCVPTTSDATATAMVNRARHLPIVFFSPLDVDLNGVRLSAGPSGR